MTMIIKQMRNKSSEVSRGKENEQWSYSGPEKQARYNQVWVGLGPHGTGSEAWGPSPTHTWLYLACFSGPGWLCLAAGGEMGGVWDMNGISQPFLPWLPSALGGIPILCLVHFIQ